MIKILLVVCNNSFNGTERYTVDLAYNLPSEKFDVTIATPIKGPLSDVIYSKGLKEFVYNNGKTNYYSFKGLKNLYSYIRKNKIDIVHANAKSHPCFVSKLAGVKFIVETRHGIFYSKIQLETLPIWRKYYEHIKQYFVNKIIAISENDKQILVKYFSIKPDKIRVIYNGLDFNSIVRDDTTELSDIKNNNEFIIGNVGRFTFQKAQEVLLEAFEMLNKQYMKASLILIGQGENEEKLKAYVNANGLGEKVKFKGYIKEIYSELSKFDALVLTSRFEGTPYIIFEAMALGVPVITTDVGGISNIMKDGFDAIITQCDDPESTKDAIEKLLLDAELRKSIINNAFDTVRKYTVRNMVDNTMKLYLCGLN
jgi:glycosyltransferase involved in cell wall biosynthesis